MTQQKFNELFKSGDAGALWAAVENHISGAVNAAHAEKDAGIAVVQKAHDEYRAKALATAQAVLAECRNPEADANLTVPAIIAEATKDETEKKRDVARAKIAAGMAELEALLN